MSDPTYNPYFDSSNDEGCSMLSILDTKGYISVIYVCLIIHTKLFPVDGECNPNEAQHTLKQRRGRGVIASGSGVPLTQLPKNRTASHTHRSGNTIGSTKKPDYIVLYHHPCSLLEQDNCIRINWCWDRKVLRLTAACTIHWQEVDPG